MPPDKVFRNAGCTSGRSPSKVAWQCFARPPTLPELELGKKFFSEHARYTTDPTETLTDYCLALVNSNAFCFVD